MQIHHTNHIRLVIFVSRARCNKTNPKKKRINGNFSIGELWSHTICRSRHTRITHREEEHCEIFFLCIGDEISFWYHHTIRHPGSCLCWPESTKNTEHLPGVELRKSLLRCGSKMNSNYLINWKKNLCLPRHSKRTDDIRHVVLVFGYKCVGNAVSSVANVKN